MITSFPKDFGRKKTKSTAEETREHFKGGPTAAPTELHHAPGKLTFRLSALPLRNRRPMPFFMVSPSLKARPQPPADCRPRRGRPALRRAGSCREGPEPDSRAWVSRPVIHPWGNGGSCPLPAAAGPLPGPPGTREAAEPPALTEGQPGPPRTAADPEVAAASCPASRRREGGGAACSLGSARSAARGFPALGWAPRPRNPGSGSPPCRAPAQRCRPAWAAPAGDGGEPRLRVPPPEPYAAPQQACGSLC